MKSNNLSPVVTQDSEQLRLEEMPITKHLIILRGHLFKNRRFNSHFVFVYCLLPIIATKCYLNPYEHSFQLAHL